MKQTKQMGKMTKEEITKILQGVYQAGDEGEPEESAVPTAVDAILDLFKAQEQAIKEELLASATDSWGFVSPDALYENLVGSLTPQPEEEGKK